MVTQSAWRAYGAAAVVAVAALCTVVIAAAFLAPERLFGSTVGAVTFFVAFALMIACAVLANVYDLRGMLRDEFG